jgi:hypothetical protein
MVLQSNDTNANAKEGTVNVRHYTNAEEPVSAVGGFTTSTANEVYLGGGFSAGNAATLLGFYTAANNTTTVGTERYRIGSDGTSTWYVGGSTAMTLNSTGLGVGGSPTHKLTVSTTAGATAIFTSSGAATAVTIDNTNANAWGGNLAIATGGVNAGFFGTIGSLVGSTSQNIAIWSTSGNGIVFHTNGDSTARAIIDTSGNVGIGGAPAAAVAGNKKLQITGSNNSAVVLGTSSVNAAARNWAVISNWNAFGDLVFQQSNALGGDPLASGAGTSRMTLDASGRLILLASTTTPATLTTNGELTMTATSNTNLRFSYRGSDGTTRVADITLA